MKNHNLCTSFISSKVSVAVVLKMLSELSHAKEPGLDQSLARFLRDAAEVITLSIPHVINVFYSDR